MKTREVDFVFRLAIVSVFFFNGISKLQNIDGVAAWMESYDFPSLFLFPAIGIELIASLLILFRIERCFSYLSLMAFCALTAIVFHFDFSNPMQTTAFLKNMALMAGIYFLMVSETRRSS